MSQVAPISLPSAHCAVAGHAAAAQSMTVRDNPIKTTLAAGGRDQPGLVTTTFTEQHPIAPPRAVLTVRAVRWATDALSDDETTVSALARHLGVAWEGGWFRSGWLHGKLALVLGKLQAVPEAGGTMLDACLFMEETSRGLAPIGGYATTLIVAGACVTRDGVIVHEPTREAIEGPRPEPEGETP